MDILNNESTGQPSTPDPQCSICLNELNNKCYTNACEHLFCFDCLQRWSNTCLEQCSISDPTCPLCKQTFRYIYHSFDDLGIFETYTVPTLPSPSPANEQEFRQIAFSNRMIVPILIYMNRQNHTRMSTIRREIKLDELGNNYRQLNHHSPRNFIFRNPTSLMFGIDDNFVK
ncbi:uncharacterized RING finger protein C32D5.10-like [Acyrthosiphon pisum]|uniref:RING-type E3 ubiquitin transferase n=1 Tax=Acyrthosiphon pisum TaxID=7029 RepID=A0A8R2BAE3_ACYPI|nr:uncharacterized RING finger protein C32D5.10-like [Acyrthosiphon pisum]|eukprot:XP_008188517.1 PREDICTED: uncharacterized RING finger protein C32D5.10-like [Acyrthosiphon pisum]